MVVLQCCQQLCRVRWVTEQQLIGEFGQSCVPVGHGGGQRQRENWSARLPLTCHGLAEVSATNDCQPHSLIEDGDEFSESGRVEADVDPRPWTQFRHPDDA